MNKRLISAVLLIAMLLCCFPVAYAHDDQAKHDNDLKYVLFGENNKGLNGEERIAFKAIANAAAITIDQFSPNESQQNKRGVFEEIQNELDSLGLPKLSLSFDDIDLNIHVSADNKNITAVNHRKYTHLGWNYRKYPNEEFWKIRKQVLVNTVNRVLFNTQTPLSWIPYLSDILYSPSEQCDAFCAMVYYVHILGDHIEGDDPNKLTDIEPLIQYTNMSTPGIIAELKEQLQIVFASQKASWTYAALIQGLTDLGIRAEHNCGTWGSIDTVEKCTVNQKYAKELLDILARYIPGLLRNETFFTVRFK